jgi:hypothetical protein
MELSVSNFFPKTRKAAHSCVLGPFHAVIEKRIR